MNRVKKIIKATFLLTFALIFSMSGLPLFNAVNTNAATITSTTQPLFKVGSHVQVNSTAATETNGFDLKNHREWTGEVKSIAPVNYDQSKYEHEVEFGDGSKNLHIAEQDLREVSNQTPSFKVGETVRIRSGAWSESNGYDLTPHQNWVGVVKSVTRSTWSYSYFEYDIEYPDGTHNVHVVDHDLVKYDSKFNLNIHVVVSDDAIKETNGNDLIPHSGWTGVVKSVTPINYDQSKFEYEVEFGDGSKNLHIAEQDLRELSNQTASFKVGDQVKIRKSAWLETNGYDLTPHQNQIGTVKKVTFAPWSMSYFEYDIEYSDGTHSVHVADQDLMVKPVEKPSVTIVSTINYDNSTPRRYLSRVDGKYRVFHAIDQENRNDGLYGEPLGTVSGVATNTDAKALQGKIVYAEKEVKLSNGETWVYINIDGNYKWINKEGLSTGNPVWLYSSGLSINSYNKNGQIVYKIDNTKTKYAANIRTAINNWNKALGTNVFVEASATTPISDINLTFSDYNDPNSGNIAEYGSLGGIIINDKYFASTKYNDSSRVRVLQHELGHSLGLDHTGQVDNGVIMPWSWSDATDTMWSQFVDWDITSESIITQNDIDAVKMLIKLGDYANSHPLSTLRTTLPIVWIS